MSNGENITPPMDPSISNLPPQDPPNDPPPGDVVPREAYEGMKRDMINYKTKMKELEQRLDGIKVQGFKEKEDWKEVARIHEEKAKELETKYSRLSESLVNREKYAKLAEEAVKHGINPAALPDLELIDFDELVVETTSTGKILVSGQDRAIAKLKTLRPHWFSKSVTSINPTTPSTTVVPNGVVTIADLNAAELQYKKTKSELDRRAYQELIFKYKSQRPS